MVRIDSITHSTESRSMTVPSAVAHELTCVGCGGLDRAACAFSGHEEFDGATSDLYLDLLAIQHLSD